MPQNEFSEFSLQTLMKFLYKIRETEQIKIFYQKYLENITNDFIYENSIRGKDIFNKMLHYAVYSIYRSFDKEIENKKIDLLRYTEDKNVVSAYKALITITDKDLCHCDKNSKTFEFQEVMFVKSFLSDQQLFLLIDFMNKTVLNKIKEAILEKNNIEISKAI
ncbi:MAG: hypothetical protein WCX88_03910 [Patescibacteria group bacterium]